MIEVGKTYYTQSGGEYVSVTVSEVWQQAGIEWAKVSGVFVGAGMCEGVTLNTGSLYTADEYKAKMQPAKFVAKYAGKCANCGERIEVGQDCTFKHPLNVRVKRNPAVHQSCYK